MDDSRLTTEQTNEWEKEALRRIVQGEFTLSDALNWYAHKIVVAIREGIAKDGLT